LNADKGSRTKTPSDFRAVSYVARLYSGQDALEGLPAEVERTGAQRAFVLCGRTVSRKTTLIARIKGLLGARYGGLFDELDKDTSLDAVRRAAVAARAAQAELLIGVGAGSVLQGVRVVAVLLAEKDPVEKLITQYPDDGPAVSPRLRAPKLPIINVLTAPTTAQNRAGSGVKNPALDHRMEFFDPKTRPVAVFWDAEALLSAPAAMMRSSACAIYWRAALNLASLDMPPLVEGDRLQAWRLASRALGRVADPHDWQARIDLCAATWLQNRDADDGGVRVRRNWVLRAVYAFSVALFNLHPEIGQGETYSALTPGAMRVLGGRELKAHRKLADAMGIAREEAAGDMLPERLACELERVYGKLGMPLRLSQLDIPRASLETILAHSLKNFNSDPDREFLRERVVLEQALQAAW
jgi:alcohol dehydrogenase class IV